MRKKWGSARTYVVVMARRVGSGSGGGGARVGVNESVVEGFKSAGPEVVVGVMGVGGDETGVELSRRGGAMWVCV